MNKLNSFKYLLFILFHNMIGFKNIGNTCYLNSGLQMIVQNNDLCKMISSYSSRSNILNKINDLIIKYYSGTVNVIDPREIKKIVEKKQEMFEGYGQHDSTEFVIFLLNTIDDEIKNIDKESTGIKSLFGIESNVRIKCKLMDCLKVYNKKEIDNFLILDIDSTHNSLEDAYRSYKSSVKLDSDNKYFCENCQSKRIASKRHTVETWPTHLFVWLKRFKQTNKRITKNNQQLDIPFDWRHKNKLQGAIIHSGDLNGGHYVYIGKQNNQWYLFNDSSVSEIKNEQDVKTILSNAYWLYYKKF